MCCVAIDVCVSVENEERTRLLKAEKEGSKQGRMCVFVLFRFRFGR